MTSRQAGRQTQLTSNGEIMTTRFAVICCAAWLSLTLGVVNQSQAFPVTYTYTGSNYGTNTNAPCQPGFSSEDHIAATVVLDSIYWGMEVDNPPGSSVHFFSGPYSFSGRVRLTTNASGGIIRWYFYDRDGVEGSTNGEPDGRGDDGVFGDHPTCALEAWGAGVHYAAGSRVPEEVWTMQIAPTPTPTPIPSPVPSVTPARCVLSHGYWMNHPETWCMETIHIAGVTYTQAEAIALMRHSSGRDKTYSLMRALITARLNVECQGANAFIIRCYMTFVDNFLCHHPVGSDVRPNSPEWNYVRDIYDELVSFNDGASGDPRCDSSLR